MIQYKYNNIKKINISNLISAKKNTTTESTAFFQHYAYARTNGKTHLNFYILNN